MPMLLYVKISFYTALCILITATFLSMGFYPPKEAERQKAIGSLKGLPQIFCKAFSPDDDFKLIPTPKEGDWLSEHKEKGQTYDDFVNSNIIRPDESRNKIYLLPFGQFSENNTPSLEILNEYATIYFSMEANVLPLLNLEDKDFTERINRFTGKRQIFTSDILSYLEKKSPKDAYCILAITMEDLYPNPSWNFVFGEASILEKVGVFSFARYDPAFYGDESEEGDKKLLLWRSCKVLVHETAHMFGLTHCIFFRCVMNGSNHLNESDSRPLHLCPVCLRKLQHCIKFDIIDRYTRLNLFYKKIGFGQEASWVGNRLKRIL